MHQHKALKLKTDCLTYKVTGYRSRLSKLKAAGRLNSSACGYLYGRVLKKNGAVTVEALEDYVAKVWVTLEIENDARVHPMSLEERFAYIGRLGAKEDEEAFRSFSKRVGI